MTDITELYANTGKVSWAGQNYQSEVLTNPRSFDYAVKATRSSSRDYQISLLSELVGKNAPDRVLALLIDGDTDPLKQVASVFCDGSATRFIRFSRSEKG